MSQADKAVDQRQKIHKCDYDKVVRLFGWIILGVLSSCSGISSLDVSGQRRSAYESYLDKNLKVDRLFMKLRETAVGRAFKITAESAALQATVAPGFEQLPTEGKETFIVSLEMQDWSRFSISDIKFFLGTSPSTSAKEIMDNQLLNTLYPFAVPHDRAFIVEFDASEESELKIQTSQGQFKFNFGEGEE